MTKQTRVRGEEGRGGGEEERGEERTGHHQVTRYKFTPGAPTFLKPLPSGQNLNYNREKMRTSKIIHGNTQHRK